MFTTHERIIADKGIIADEGTQIQLFQDCFNTLQSLDQQVRKAVFGVCFKGYVVHPKRPWGHLAAPDVGIRLCPWKRLSKS